jgi:hypothetical protein
MSSTFFSRSAICIGLVLTSLSRTPAKGEIATPRLGAVRCPDGTVRFVFGIPASLLLMPTSLSTAESLASSSRALLISSDGVVRFYDADGSLRAEAPASDPHPVMGVENDLESAVVWLPSTHALMFWNNGEISSTDVAGSLPGPVLAVRRSGDIARFLVQDGAGVSEVAVSTKDGRIESTHLLPGVQWPAIWAGPHVVYMRHDQLVVLNSAGKEFQMELPMPGMTLQALSEEWVHVSSPDGKCDWAVHIDDYGCELGEMPSLRGALRNSAKALAGAGK